MQNLSAPGIASYRSREKPALTPISASVALNAFITSSCTIARIRPAMERLAALILAVAICADNPRRMASCRTSEYFAFHALDADDAAADAYSSMTNCRSLRSCLFKADASNPNKLFDSSIARNTAYQNICSNCFRSSSSSSSMFTLAMTESPLRRGYIFGFHFGHLYERLPVRRPDHVEQRPVELRTFYRGREIFFYVIPLGEGFDVPADFLDRPGHFHDDSALQLFIVHIHSFASSTLAAIFLANDISGEAGASGNGPGGSSPSSPGFATGPAASPSAANGMFSTPATCLRISGVTAINPISTPR